MIFSLLNQFRKRYPTGSLTADLLTLHNDQYVVRAQIQVDGETLATGLAAASSIETAEDQARTRAIQAIGLEIDIDIHPTPPTAISESIINQAAPISVSQAAPTTDDAPIANSQPLQLESDFPSGDHFETLLPISPEKAVKPSASDASKSQTDASKPQAEPSKAPTKDSSSSKTAKLNLTQPNPLDNSQGPIDLSDIIAQTDVELRRLGWTSNQGREYLEQTYQKRSRQQLSDEELLAFLLYLESQPSPRESQI
ncbi:MAG: hypothetical protein QNJ46_10795 [Leptolyngbyaceae cyanobacterium MO_188.B28]|nr:hypothetical protein [Leptolyngbyaceae cyanobacterium MO_188.B28]